MSFCVKLYLSVPISGGVVRCGVVWCGVVLYYGVVPGAPGGGELLLHNLQSGPTMMVYQVFTPHTTIQGTKIQPVGQTPVMRT